MALVFNSNKCQISKQQITFYGAIFFSERNETWSKEGTSTTRSSNTTNTKRVKVIPRSHQLLSPILTRPLSQDHISQKTSHQLGLDTIYRCSISPPQTMDMQYTTKDNISLLWPHKTCRSSHRYQWIQTWSSPHPTKQTCSICFQDPHTSWIKVCKHWMWMFISSFQLREVSHLHLWKPCHSVQQPQALRNDSEEANTCSTTLPLNNVAKTTKIWL